MLKVNDVIKAKRFGTKQLVIEVIETGVYVQFLKPVSSNELTVDTDYKQKFISNEELKQRKFMKVTSMSLKQGTIGSAWN